MPYHRWTPKKGEGHAKTAKIENRKLVRIYGFNLMQRRRGAEIFLCVLCVSAFNKDACRNS
jgi:hypothetical protein